MALVELTSFDSALSSIYPLVSKEWDGTGLLIVTSKPGCTDWARQESRPKGSQRRTAYSRSAVTGSVRVARHAGTRHAAADTIAMAANATTKVAGSRGLTSKSSVPSSLVRPMAAAAPHDIPPAASRRP